MKTSVQSAWASGLTLLCLMAWTPNLHAQSHLRPEVDAAVDGGLEFLAKSQTQEGFFTGQFGKSPGTVGLAGMAFLAKGHTPGYGPYGAAINTCVDYCLESQQPDGLIDRRNESAHGPMYAHYISTLFLSEVSGMLDPERQKKTDEVLPKAVKLLLDAQSVQKSSQFAGGWRYSQKSPDSDLSCTGWPLLALKSTRLSGAPVPIAAIENAVKFIRSLYRQSDSSFGYMQDDGRFKITLTGVGLLCLELTGFHGDAETTKAGDCILLDMVKIPNEEHGFYGTYYSAQGMFQLGGKYWEKYSEWMYSTWLPKQRQDGSWQERGGREGYATAIMVLALTVPYRQLPIYQRDETLDDEKE